MAGRVRRDRFSRNRDEYEHPGRHDDPVERDRFDDYERNLPGYECVDVGPSDGRDAKSVRPVLRSLPYGGIENRRGKHEQLQLSIHPSGDYVNDFAVAKSC